MKTAGILAMINTDPSFECFRVLNPRAFQQPGETPSGAGRSAAGPDYKRHFNGRLFREGKERVIFRFAEGSFQGPGELGRSAGHDLAGSVAHLILPANKARVPVLTQHYKLALSFSSGIFEVNYFNKGANFTRRYLQEFDS